MTVGTEYADDLKRELLTEMAENFFSRRRHLEERLEALTALRAKVLRQAEPALADWRALRTVLLGVPAADAFLTGLGFDVAALAAFPLEPAAPKLRRPLALTAAGRYKKAVLALYEDLHQTAERYNEGGFAPDPREPRRKVRIPGYNHLLEVVRELNVEIEAVNNCQCPSDMLHFTKSLDPVLQQQERACGAMAGDAACRLDTDMAFASLDETNLGVPDLPTPPPLETVRETLAALAETIQSESPEATAAALDAAGRQTD